VARTGEIRNSHGILVAESLGKHPVGRPKVRSEDNIKVELKELGCAMELRIA
jgi:hypothetical protein